jgi:hypothetical protein
MELEQMLEALGKKLGCRFEIESTPGNKNEIRLVRVNEMRTVYTNFVSRTAMENCLTHRLNEK